MIRKTVKITQMLFNELRYGDMRRVLCSGEVNSVDMNDFFKKYNLKVDKKKVELPIVSSDKLSLVELDAPFICSFARSLNPGFVFEIGTGKGYSARCFLGNMKNGMVFSLDKEKRDVGISDNRLYMLRGDSKIFPFQPFYNKADLFFIDGNHSHSYVYSDSVNGFKCTRDGGFMLWHDFCEDYLGCVSAVMEFTGRYDLVVHKISGTRFAVAQVVKH